MRAFILAGGLGTRLRSVVRDRPKPLAPIGGASFLEHQIAFLKANRIREFVLCVGYRHEQIREYFGDGQRWDISIEYSVEEQALGTAGALKHAERYAKGTFLAMNGDTFFNLPVDELIQAHRRYQAQDTTCLGTIALKQLDDPRSFGSVTTDRRGTIVGFCEKPEEEASRHDISAGFYVMEPDIFDLIPISQTVSLERETFPRVIHSDRRLYGHRVDGFFVDIGTPEGYHRFRTHLGELTP